MLAPIKILVRRHTDTDSSTNKAREQSKLLTVPYYILSLLTESVSIASKQLSIILTPFTSLRPFHRTATTTHNTRTVQPSATIQTAHLIPPSPPFHILTPLLF